MNIIRTYWLTLDINPIRKTFSRVLVPRSNSFGEESVRAKLSVHQRDANGTRIIGDQENCMSGSNCKVVK